MNAMFATNTRRRTEDIGRSRQSIPVLFITFLLTVNLAPAASSDSGNIYLNPVIFIHGTMGSHLVDEETGRHAWGIFSRKDANGKTVEAIRRIALPMIRDRSLGDIRDSVSDDGTLKKVQFKVFQSLELNAPFYQGIIDEISGKNRFGNRNWNSSEDAPRKRTCCEFSYDWRRSCDENAVRLAAFVESEKRRIEAERQAAGNPLPVRFDIVAHSQGALLTRYYLRYGNQPLPEDGGQPDLNWSGADHIETVVLMGAPNAGVAKTLKFLTHGHKHHLSLPYFEPAVVGTMPSIYQMLPREADGVLLDPETEETLDPLDFDLWLEKEWGLANPEQDKELAIILPHVKDPAVRRSIALDHLRKCLISAEQFQASLDVPAYRPTHLRMVMCACDSKATPGCFLASPREVSVHQKTKGDGMVPLNSASRCPSPAMKNGIRGPSWDAIGIFKTNHDKLATKAKVSKFIIEALDAR